MEYKKEELEKFIFEDNLSYEEIGKLYNCTGGNIRKVAKKLGIELPQRRKINEKETFNKGISKIIKDVKETKTEVKVCLCCGEILSNIRNIYCNITCEHLDKSNKNYQYFLDNPEEFKRSNFQPSAYIRNNIMLEQNNQCNICKCEPIHNTKSLIFVLDHIDGDASNNIRENYRMICPNCDSQLDTYKSKNKNSARTDRSKYYGTLK